MNKRVLDLRKQSIETKPSISIERGIIVKQSYEKYEGTVEKPILRALAFKDMMERKTLCINDGELIVGEKGQTPQNAPTYPELTCYTKEDFEILNSRKEVSFKTSKQDIDKYLNEIVPFFDKRSMRKRILQNMSSQWKSCYKAGVFTEFMEQRGPGHTVAGDKIYKYGFKDIKKIIKKEIKNLDMINDVNAYSKKVELQAMNICCDAIITLGERYSRFAYQMAENTNDETRKQELFKISEVCKNVPANKPRNFHEAIQMYWFVHIGVTTELNIWDAFSPGRLDQHLIEFYNHDIENNNLTRDEAKELLQLLWIKFNNQPAPPKVGVTMKESSTYTDFANINTGGITSDGKDGVNDVSYLILEVMDEMKLVQPNSNVQISRLNPNKFIKKACEIACKGWGQPAFYNTEEIISELLHMGKSIDDARLGGSSGCVETGAFGLESYILTGYLNLSKILDITLHNGYDNYSKKQIGLKTGKIEDFKTFEDLKNAYKKQLNHFVDIKIQGNHIIEKLYMDEMPVPFLSCIIDDCITNAIDYNAGGARYNTNYIQGVGIGDLTDSFSAIKFNVFDNKNFELKQLLDAIDNNFDGYEKVFKIVNNKTPKYGNDDDYADNLMVELFKMFHDSVTGRPTVRKGVYRINMLPTTCHIYFGSVLSASPNGRKAYQPLPDGISPSKNADRKGPTAIMNSVAKMDHVKTGGTLLNQKFTPDVLQGTQGINNLASLIKGFFKMNCHHIQFNVFDKETLIDAQKNPENYKNLIVRVAGYSDYFNNLNKDLQDEIINRTDLKL